MALTPGTIPYVLVVDDDPTVRELIELTLTDEGYAVVTAGSADEALRIVTARPAALILFDLSLPGMSPEELVTAYRALPGADAQMVAVSGFPGLAQEAARLGANGCLAKPFDLDDLLAMVSAAIS